MARRNRLEVRIGAAILVHLMTIASALGCACVSIKEELVTFLGQANVIVWDPDSQTEHFIRNARFSSKVDDFGFIAPSPSLPELVEVDEAVFATLAELEPPHDVDSGAAGYDDEQKGADAPTVLQTKDVAGYRATTLKATDSAGLAKWMRENGYATTPAIEEWTKFYIRKNWLLTAFKVLKEDGRAETGTIRMTFKTDRPFNPYLVPSDNIPLRHEVNDGLILFFIGPGVYSTTQFKFDRKLNWSVPIPPDTATKVAGQLKIASLPKSSTVACFRDLNFPISLATDDLFFTKVRDTKKLGQVGSISTTWIAVTGGAVVVVIGLVAAIAKGRRNALP